SGRDALIANETLAGEDTENADGPNPGNSQELRPSEVNRESLRLIHLAGLEPATFGSVDRSKLKISLLNSPRDYPVAAACDNLRCSPVVSWPQWPRRGYLTAAG